MKTSVEKVCRTAEPPLGLKDSVPNLNRLDAPARDLVQVFPVKAFSYKFMRWFGKSPQSRAARGDLALGMGSVSGLGRLG
jgi:hypothetical protein